MTSTTATRKPFHRRMLVPRLNRFCSIFEEKKAKFFNATLAQEEAMELMRQDRLAELRAKREEVPA